MKDFWNRQSKPICALAPMDGYTDSAFRRVCKNVNSNIILFTEFTSTDGLHFAQERLRSRLRFEPEEQPIIAQIFGNNTDHFIEAVKFCEDAGFSGIDINMGCPAAHVVKSEQGAALRANPDLAFRIVEAVARATDLPVSVKTRLGTSDASDLVSFGRGLADAGADLLTIHGRTYKDPYGCPADFVPIYELQQHLSIPVIGNGGVTSLDDGRTKLGNLAGFMIGQAALGNPWAFSASGSPTFVERMNTIQKHVAWMIELRGEERGILEMRKHLIAYVKGIPNASQFRSMLARVSSLDEINAILEKAAAAQFTDDALERG